MSSREKRLGIIFVSVLLALVVGKVVMSRKDGPAPKKGVSQLTDRVQEMKELLKSKSEWDEKAEWMRQNLPSYSSEVVASADLLERIKKLARTHSLEIESQEIIRIDAEADAEIGYYPNFDRAEMVVNLQGETRKIVECIHELQTPNHFIGVDRITMEPSPKGRMGCRLLVTQWFHAGEPM